MITADSINYDSDILGSSENLRSRCADVAASGVDNHEPADTITLKADHANVQINFKEIIAVEAMDNYVKIFRNSLPAVITQITMKEIKNRLKSNDFVRVHRSYIISISYMEEYSAKSITMRGFPRPIPIGRKYLPDFKEAIKDLS